MAATVTERARRRQSLAAVGVVRGRSVKYGAAVSTTLLPGAAERPLSPSLFLGRAQQVFAGRTAIVDGLQRFTYAEFAERSQRLAGAVRSLTSPGARIGALCANSHVMLEAHHGVPLARAVLVPLNVRLRAEDLASQLEHSGAEMLIATGEFAALAEEVAGDLGIRLVLADGHGDYEELLASAEPVAFEAPDERTMLAINYTSGSTGRPKGVMYNHRGAYLQALAMAFHLGLSPASRYLWTLPMFHCDGWCLTWAVTAAGAEHHCVRGFDAGEVWRRIAAGEATHLSAAPTVLTMIAEAALATGAPGSAGEVAVTTGGAPPSPALIERLEGLGLMVTHLYGLTESYGPAVVNVWQPHWSEEGREARATLLARQGIGNIATGGVAVVAPDGTEVPADGETIGEIAIAGNNVMAGYYRDPEATAAAVRDGWLYTGDLGVRHRDGYVELRDRAKDIIITGGENVASVEIERLLVTHPAVLEAAVVAQRDETWGEVPVAFVTLRTGAGASEGELVHFCRERLAHFKAPKAVFFTELPKTSTGKVQKHVLRDQLPPRP
jgi:fatty-acyl-CoA synthase